MRHHNERRTRVNDGHVINQRLHHEGFVVLDTFALVFAQNILFITPLPTQYSDTCHTRYEYCLVLRSISESGLPSYNVCIVYYTRNPKEPEKNDRCRSTTKINIEPYQSAAVIYEGQQLDESIYLTIDPAESQIIIWIHQSNLHRLRSER